MTVGEHPGIGEGKFMKKRDIVSSIFWMSFGAVFAIGGLHYGLVRQGIPGPGSVPFIVGLITIGLSLVVFVQGSIKKSTPPAKFFPQKDSLRKLVLTLVTIVGYGAFLKSLGFVVTTFLFLLIVVALIGREKWFIALSFSLLTAVLSYLIFNALQVDLPKGFLWN
jgi:putative tricarboxylic transport membrane protein